MSKEIGGSYDKLRQLLLVEEFKNCLPGEVRTYLDERKAVTLNQAAVLADDCILTHKSSFRQSSSQFHPRNDVDTPGSYSHKVNGRKGYQRYNSLGGGNKSGFFPPGPECHYCRKRGHVMAECWQLKNNSQAQQQTFKSDMLVTQTQLFSTLSPPVGQMQQASFSRDVDEYTPFISEGFISVPGSATRVPITVLRDTVANQSLLVEDKLPSAAETATGSNVLIQGVELETLSIPLHKVSLQSDLVSDTVVVGVRHSLPVRGIDLILGNDLAGEKVIASPHMLNDPEELPHTAAEVQSVYPACAVTRAMMIQGLTEDSNAAETASPGRSKFGGTKNASRAAECPLNLAETFVGHDRQQSPRPKAPATLASNLPTVKGNVIPKDQLVKLQESDTDLLDIREKVVSESEASRNQVGCFKRSEVLMRRWRPLDAPGNEEWKVVYQIVVPKQYRSEILHLAHEGPLAGHLGINKTYQNVLQHFYWPGLRQDVVTFCKSCHTCQVTGKPNQSHRVAPLIPIPVMEEPYNRVLVDCVGPLPKTRSGNQYLLTIMCTSTRFPEAIPLRNIKTPNIVKALINFFTLVGLPKAIQSDQGSNFLSGIFQQVMYELDIKQYTSSAYHPQSHGALERFHQTLKSMIRMYCYD